MAGAVNMAVDELLLAHAADTGECIFRVYGWSEPTLSFGRNQRALGLYEPRRLADAGITAVRRPTGGRALLHHREITYSVAAPTVTASLRAAYLDLNALVVDGLRRLGIAVEIAGEMARAIPPGPLPCFDAPSPGEITAAGRKLVGSAQWRTERALLQHGSILLADDQSRLPSLASVPLPRVPAPATLTELLGHAPTMTDVADALFAAVRARDAHATDFSLDALPADAIAPVANRYRDESWTWRR